MLNDRELATAFAPLKGSNFQGRIQPIGLELLSTAMRVRALDRDPDKALSDSVIREIHRVWQMICVDIAGAQDPSKAKEAEPEAPAKKKATKKKATKKAPSNGD